MTEDEMAGWHHRLNGHGFGWTPGVGDGQGGLACCDPTCKQAAAEASEGVYDSLFPRVFRWKV